MQIRAKKTWWLLSAGMLLSTAVASAAPQDHLGTASPLHDRDKDGKHDGHGHGDRDHDHDGHHGRGDREDDKDRDQKRAEREEKKADRKSVG